MLLGNLIGVNIKNFLHIQRGQVDRSGLQHRAVRRPSKHTQYGDRNIINTSEIMRHRKQSHVQRDAWTRGSTCYNHKLRVFQDACQDLIARDWHSTNTTKP